MTARYLVGDVRKILPTLEPGSVDLVLTSPPFLALRSYLPADHPDKPAEIGSEPTPGAYIDTLLDIVELCEPLLAPHGSMCIELGDTYSGAGGYGDPESVNPAYSAERFAERWEGRAPKRFKKANDGWPEAKSLCLIPELFRISLVYGFNPLTGRPTPRWRARNVIRWCRPNPPVGALGDKFRPATSDMVVVCKSRTRYFDLDAVRTPGSPNTHARLAQGVESRPATGKKAANPNNNYGTMPEVETAGAPPLDHWLLPTQPYTGAHYATWPQDLCVTPIKAMSPLRVCRQCGKPSERITGETTYRPDDAHRSFRPHFTNGERVAEGVNNFAGSGANKGCVAERPTLGWSDCGHNNWRPGLILDPLAGSGTTLQVATGHSRDAIGIDLDARNADLAAARVGMFLEVVP